MNAKAKSELNAIIKELNSIISELESISNGVRKDFKNIGSDKCADCINSVLNNYYTVRRKLKNLDTSTVTESFAKANAR
ncbi:MAG: hypothetical protein IIX54_05225 [Clostridia bacterium]|nr:hypothetical protein [Clostridia bacterium]